MNQTGKIDIKSYMEARRALVDQALERYLPAENTYPENLSQAMRYSVMSGGKRFRPILCIASFEACAGEGDAVVPIACAIELVHTYSLIHDDLPCMDDDDLRRGRPTSHKVFGEAVAVLAGDALLSFAVELVMREGPRLVPPERIVRIVGDLFKAAGPEGMVAGQVVDMASEGKAADAETVGFIHRHKTGALIASAARCGAIAAGAIESVIERLSTYGARVGLAFQIVDDVLDVEGKFGGLKAASGLDQKKQKMTYPVVFGLEESKAVAARLVREAKDAIAPLGQAGLPLQLLADLVVNRSS
ncbi:MAG TPA: farnesyl diphosphate synthase [bacterium]|nr:farnesyl diphosphate synthase [bacterium]